MYCSTQSKNRKYIRASSRGNQSGVKRRKRPSVRVGHTVKENEGWKIEETREERSEANRGDETKREEERSCSLNSVYSVIFQ